MTNLIKNFFRSWQWTLNGPPKPYTFTNIPAKSIINSWTINTGMAGLCVLLSSATFLILGLAFFGLFPEPHVPYFHIPAVAVVDPNMSPLSPQEVIQQTPFLRELMHEYQYVDILNGHYETALQEDREVNLPSLRLEDQYMFASREEFIQHHPGLAANINILFVWHRCYNELVEMNASIDHRGFALRLVLRELQQLMVIISPQELSLSFPDLFPFGDVHPYPPIYELVDINKYQQANWY